MKPHRVAAVLALAFLVSPGARAEDSVPAYETPAGFAAPALAPAVEDAAKRAVATIRDPASVQDVDDAVRVLAGIGPGALPHVVRGLAGARWSARASLVAAVAEMDAAEATPLLCAASRDPAFAVREAAVVGLGKTGDARGAAALVERAAETSEPVWRVRVAATAALRRGVLRRVVDRSVGETALARMLADMDGDVRRAALREVAPLAVDAALAAVLDVFADPATESTDRTLALTALRAYRSPSPELLAALRRGFLSGEDAFEACEAARALFAVRGMAALDDEEVAAAVVHRLNEGDHESLHDGLARLGRPVAPWLRERALHLASRIAAGKDTPNGTPFNELLDTLIQVDESAGLAFVKELLAGKDAEMFNPETRRVALRKVEVAFAPRMRAELRAIYDAKLSDLSPEILSVIVASGGDDLAARLDAALAVPKVSSAALAILDNRSEIPVGPNLLALAAEAADPDVRATALKTLSLRDPERAAVLAEPLLGAASAKMRSRAVTLLSASREPKDFDRLVARLAVEDGSDVSPTKPPVGGPSTAPPAPVTPSDHASRAAQRRQAMVAELVNAVAMTGGDRARPVLLRVVETDPDGKVRETAALKLRAVAAAADVPKLLAVEADESDPRARGELRRTLAALPDSAEATKFFEKLISDSRSRPEALRLLAEDGSRVVPEGLASGLATREWTDDERLRALVVLLRAGRAPDAAGLAALALDARTLELCHGAARALAAAKSPDATRELLALLGKLTDPERLSAVVEALGGLGAPEAEAPLLELFSKARERAFVAASKSDPAVDLYRQCAEAIADFGSAKTGEAIVEHLLDPRLAHAVGRCSVIAHGPFQPVESAPVAIVQSLVAAFARRDDASCGRLLGARLDALAADARDVAVPEGFLAGLARYFEDPRAYGFPARPRPAAAHLLWSLVLKTAPRMSELDVMAWQALDDHLGERRRWREARDALRSYTALADVEDAARPREDRLIEDARIAVREAQALAAEGRADEALALARTLRTPDPTNAELAYRAGHCLIRLGRADAETRDHLLFAAAQDDKDARIHFYLGWVAEHMDDARAARSSYRQAVVLDHKRVEQRPSEEMTGYRGVSHDTAAYPYWYARALRAAGRDVDAFDQLAAAVALDDRLAAEALADSAFFGWDKLDAAIAAGLAKIDGGALR